MVLPGELLALKMLAGRQRVTPVPLPPQVPAGRQRVTPVSLPPQVPAGALANFSQDGTHSVNLTVTDAFNAASTATFQFVIDTRTSAPALMYPGSAQRTVGVADGLLLLPVLDAASVAPGFGPSFASASGWPPQYYSSERSECWDGLVRCTCTA